VALGGDTETGLCAPGWISTSEGRPIVRRKRREGVFEGCEVVGEWVVVGQEAGG
jgi:hypothetical protein